ncbi:DUF805 domain-containing protein [Oceanicola sp. S124]|uniref:DUF805 domain-containing protein n=1 Tax=Oceanicola sp. S124 TaxID=1042378 RepID=UPI0002559F03|nr:DUF805 domain-containing protein [Oceanicola sp. S124]
MSFSDAVRTCFRKYVTFSGRASRPEYWYFVLFGILGSILIGIVEGLLFGTAEISTGHGSIEATSDGPLSAIFSLLLILPTLSAGWRRMHDSGRSGLYLLYPIIAVIGTASYAAFIGGLSFDGVISEGMASRFDGLAGGVLALAIAVCAFSPFIVIFWLTRPSQPGENAWGPAPAGRTAA